MADNNNPRTHSVKDAMMAEIVVRELSKFTESHELIMESTQKILSRYNDIGMLIERMDKRDNIIAKCISDMPANSKVLTFAYDTGERYLSVEGLF